MADYSEKHGDDAKRLLDYLLLDYLQRGQKRGCDGSESLSKRQQPTRHRPVHGKRFVSPTRLYILIPEQTMRIRKYT